MMRELDQFIFNYIRKKFSSEIYRGLGTNDFIEMKH